MIVRPEPVETSPIATEALAPFPPLDDPALYYSRELSWLEFNDRVLEEALDATNPLLERLKFIAIYATNLDEYFMIRVAALMQQVEAEIHFAALQRRALAGRASGGHRRALAAVRRAAHRVPARDAATSRPSSATASASCATTR